MTTKQLNFKSLPELAINDNDTIPNLGVNAKGAIVYSTTLGKVLMWDGAKWSNAAFKSNVGTFSGAVAGSATGTAVSYQGSSLGLLGVWGANSSTIGALQFYLSDSTGNLGGEQMRLTSTGLGIGTNSPLTKLHLQDNGAVFIQMTDVGDGASRIGQNGTALTFGVDSGDGTTERARIDSSGNFLLGTTSIVPSCKLNVFGGINSTNGGLNVSGTGGFYNSSNKFGVDNNAGATRMYSSGANSATRGSFEFHITDSVGSLDLTAMTLDVNGNLGIGTSSPTAKLAVNGDALINGITVGRGAGDIVTNTAVGLSALVANTTGTSHTAIGVGALQSNTTGTDNTAIGRDALKLNTTATGGVAVGGYALANNTIGSGNTGVGINALFANTSGSSNVSLGYSSLQNNTTASNNTAVGYQAGYSGTTTLENVFIGGKAGYSATTGTGRSVAVGYEAAARQTTAVDNVAIGYYALHNAETGSQNVAIGSGIYGVYPSAGDHVTTGSKNTLVGCSAGAYINTGSKNTVIGAYNGNQGGLDIRTASNYIVLSDGDGSPRGIFNASGNFGLGVTPGAWNENFRVFQPASNYASFAGDSSNGFAEVTSNCYASSASAWSFYASLGATRYSAQLGAHRWYNAGSGTAGAVIASGSWTPSMTLDASGNLGLGVTPSAWSEAKALQIQGTGLGGALYVSNSGVTGMTSNYYFAGGDVYAATGFATRYYQYGGQHIWNTAPSGTANNPITFTQAMMLDANSNLTVTGSATIQGITVGCGAGAVSTNTAAGVSALAANTNGFGNVAFGYNALLLNTDGDSNSGIGREALRANQTGTKNTAVGRESLYSNTSGSFNVALGVGALQSSITGSNNTALGYQALFSNTTGSGNVCVGSINSAGVNNPVFNVTTENNRVVMGSTAVTNAYIQVPWTVVSDARDKTNFALVPHGLEFVKQLKPVAYQFKTSRKDETPNGNVRYGFKAQDILALEGKDSVVVDSANPDLLMFNSDALIPILVKAIQELTARLAKLESKI